MMIMSILTIQIIAILTYMNLWFLVTAVKRRNDLADLAWDLGFILVALLGWLFNPGPLTLALLILTALWGLRLAWHIGFRLRKKPEDRRYRQWRQEWGSRWLFNSGI